MKQKKTLEKLISDLENDIKDLEQKILGVVKDNSILNEKFQLLISIKGIGKLTAFSIIARTPDIKNFKSPKQFAAYIGITTKQNQSGT